jgi:hypothetical protein
VLCRTLVEPANWILTPFGGCCVFCRDRWTAAQEIDGHHWLPRLPPREKPRPCEAGRGMDLQMGQPRFKQCGAPSTHTRPWLSKHSRWPMALCEADAAVAESEGALVLKGEWWPEDLRVRVVGCFENPTPATSGEEPR